jgi:hypothetical protein
MNMVVCMQGHSQKASYQLLVLITSGVLLMVGRDFICFVVSWVLH